MKRTARVDLHMHTGLLRNQKIFRMNIIMGVEAGFSLNDFVNKHIHRHWDIKGNPPPNLTYEREEQFQ